MRTTRLLAFLSLVSAALSQLPPGIQLSDSDQIDIRFPLTVSQCDPVVIYYNTTGASSVGIDTSIPDEVDVVRLRRLITLNIPVGIGYLVWICNIPAGHSFIAEYSYRRVFTVQPGSSSSCLRDVTATYSAAVYLTSDFGTYTANPPLTAPLSIPDTQLASSTVPFPTGPFSTITVNPDLAVPLTITNPSPPTATLLSTISPSSSQSSPPRKIGIIIILCSTIGVIAIIAITTTFVYRRRRRDARLRSIRNLVSLDEELPMSPRRNYRDRARGSLERSTWVAMNTTSDPYGPLLQATEPEPDEHPRPVRPLEGRHHVFRAWNE